MKRRWVQLVAAVNATLALSLLLVSCAGNPQKARLRYLQKGDAYMKQKQYASAAIEYRNALKVDPRYVEGYLHLANADMALRDGNAAYQALGQAISIDPNQIDARIMRAQLLSTARNDKGYALATDDVDYVIQHDPKNVAAYRLLGSILAAQKQYDKALQEFSKASALSPNNAGLYIDIALVDIELRNATDAELNMKKAVQVDSHAVQGYLDLANFYRVQHHDSGQAETTLQAGIQANPDAIPLYLDLALVFETQGKQSDAENTLASLSSQLPKSTAAAMGIGDFYRDARMNDRALAEYQRALSLDPKNITIEERIENFYLDNGQSDLAAKLDGGLLKQSPKDVVARVNHGRILMAQGKPSDAVQWFQKLAADAADSPQAHYYLAMAYEQNNQLAEANAELQQTLRVSPSLPLALTALVDLNFRQGKYSVAQLYAQELVNENQADPRSHLMLGETLLRLGQVKQAGDQFAAAEKLAPNDPSVHTSLASLYATEKKFPDAEKELKTALAAAPKNIAILTDYVNFLISQKQQPKANALVAQFLSQNPDQPDAHLLMGQIYMLEKNQSAALSETQKALQLNPKSVNAYLQMGQIYRNQGNNSAAIQAYEQGMTLAPPTAPEVTVVGSIYLDEGNLPKATDEFQKALNIDPNFMVAANNLAWIYAEQGKNLDVALGLAQKAKAQDPTQLSFSDTLAWIMYRKGNYAGALPLLQDCVKKQPDSAQFHYHLGMVLVADGQKAQGKAQIEAALHMNLDSEDAEQARKALSQ